MCHFVLHEAVQCFAHSMSIRYKAFVSGPINEGGSGGVGEGNLLLEYLLLCENLCAILPNCHKQ